MVGLLAVTCCACSTGRSDVAACNGSLPPLRHLSGLLREVNDRTATARDIAPALATVADELTADARKARSPRLRGNLQVIATDVRRMRVDYLEGNDTQQDGDDLIAHFQAMNSVCPSSTP